MVRPKSRVSKVLMVGPLMPFAADFSSRLKACGYAPLTIVNELRVMAHLSRWMETGDLTMADLSSELLQDYEASVRASGRRFMSSNGSLVPLRQVLGIAPSTPEPAAVSAARELFASFRSHLLDERGLAESTATAYLLRARRFLAWSAADGSVSALTIGDVTRAVLRQSQNVSVGSAQFFVAALRSFLRLCFAEGLLTVDLAPAALAVTGHQSPAIVAAPGDSPEGRPSPAARL